MSATNFLDNCYSELSSATGQLYFFPYSGTNEVLAGSRIRQNYDAEDNSDDNDPSLKYASVMFAAIEDQDGANNVMLFLTPILLPLTIATFALALAIDMVAFLTTLVTYPIASVLDASPSF